MATALVTTEPMSIEAQAKSLQQSLTETLANFFEQLPELNMYTAQSAALVEQARDIKVFARDLRGAVSVFNPEAYSKAAEQIKALAYVLEGIEEIIHPYTQQAFKLHRTLSGLETQYKAEATGETSRLKSEMAAFAVEESARRREAEQRIAEEARKREQDRLIAEAAMVHADGKVEQAEAIFEEAMQVQAPATVMPSMVPQTAGVQQRTTWTFDEKSIDRETLNPAYLIPDLKAIGAAVRSMKKQAERHLGGKTVEGKWVPAVRVIESKTTVVK